MNVVQTKIIMGMPISIEIVDEAMPEIYDEIFNYFKAIDSRFSTYKKSSEISQINKGLSADRWSSQMKQVLRLCEETKRQTKGYFDIQHNGKLDPSGLVKGWAINNAAKILRKHKIHNFFIEAGGDIQVSGHNSEGLKWKVGIRNPFDSNQIVKILNISKEGVATSGLYIRGEHIYNPLNPRLKPRKIKSLTVIGPNIYEADRFATASFAMDLEGINFIESRPGLEAYMIDDRGIATFTTGFSRYVNSNV